MSIRVDCDSLDLDTPVTGCECDEPATTLDAARAVTTYDFSIFPREPAPVSRCSGCEEMIYLDLEEIETREVRS